MKAGRINPGDDKAKRLGFSEEKWGGYLWETGSLDNSSQDNKCSFNFLHRTSSITLSNEGLSSLAIKSRWSIRFSIFVDRLIFKYLIIFLSIFYIITSMLSLDR